MYRRLLYVIMFWSLGFYVRAQNLVVTSIHNNFNFSDTMVNFMRDPGLQAWDLRCLWNDGGNCFKDNAGQCSSSNAGGFSLTPTGGFNGPFSTVFLKGYSNHFGFDEGFGISRLAFTRRMSNGSSYLATLTSNSPEIWKQSPSRSAMTSRWGLCSVYDNPLTNDLFRLINTAPGDSIDSLVVQSFEFDFVSGGTYFDLTYVFASDEYDTNTQINILDVPNSQLMDYNPTPAARICGESNDGIGMFLSGPGIVDSYTNNATNIAVVPGSNLPVCVRTIHPQLDTSAACGLPANAQYFKWNTDTTFPFSGYTTALNVKKVQLNPCDTYHLSLVISESGSGAVQDYGGGSLSQFERFNLGNGNQWAASSLVIKKHSAHTGFWQPAPLKLYDGFGKDTIAEGCPGMEMRFVRFFNLNQPDSIHLLYDGTAQYGIDYDNLPEWVYFDPGQDTVSFIITPTEDNTNEPIEHLRIRLLPPGEYECPVDTTEVDMWIADRPPLEAFILDTFYFNPCDTDSITIGPSYVNGLQPFSFQWSSGGTEWFETVAPTSTQNYTLTIYDACMMDSIVLTAVARVAPAPEFELINNDSTINCAQAPIPIGFKITNNYYPQLHYKWGLNNQTDSIIYVNPLYNGTHYYTLKAYLPCMPDSFPITLTVNVENDPLLLALDDIYSTSCPGRSHTFEAVLDGGYEPYTYGWSTGENTLSKTASPLATTTYTFTATDVCGLDTIVHPATLHIPPYDSLEILGPSGFDFPCPVGYLTIGSGDYRGKGGIQGTNEAQYTYSWNNWKTTGKTTQYYTETDSLMVLQMTDTCGVDTAIAMISVSVFKGPFVSIDLPDTLHGCLGEEFIVRPTTEGGVRPYAYAWNNEHTDSTWTFVPKQHKSQVHVTVTDACDMRDADTVTVYATRPLADFDVINDQDETALMRFENLSREAITYRWYFGDGGESTDENPQYHYAELENWEVQLIASDSFGCSDDVTKPLDIPLNFFIPNAFTPNDDGSNDIWRPKGYGFKSYRCTIYNRWGEVVYGYTYEDTSSGWDGRHKDQMAPAAVYTYVIVAEPISGSPEEIRGNVLLMR